MTILLASNPQASHVASGANAAASAWSGLVRPNPPEGTVWSPPLDVAPPAVLSEVTAAELDSTSALLDSTEVDVVGAALVDVAVVVVSGGVVELAGEGADVVGVVGVELVGAGVDVVGGVLGVVGAIVEAVVVVAAVLLASDCPQADASNVTQLTQPSQGRSDEGRWGEVNFMGDLYQAYGAIDGGGGEVMVAG